MVAVRDRFREQVLSRGAVTGTPCTKALTGPSGRGGPRPGDPDVAVDNEVDRQ